MFLSLKNAEDSKFMNDLIDITPKIIFSQWDLLGMTLFGFVLGYFTNWYSNKKNKTSLQKSESGKTT